MKKNWEVPSIEVLSVGETAYRWTGIYRDGGYIGDGILSGHGTWTKPSKPSNPSNPEDIS